MLKTFCIAVTLTGLAAALSAQTIPPDTFKVDYYSNAHVSDVPDGTVRITNVGTQIGSTGAASGNLCAMVYVLTPDQQLAECCGCALTPDGLHTLSIDNDLTSNPLTAVTPTTGDIKIVSSTGFPTCNPAKPLPVAGIRAWATHTQNPIIETTCAVVVNKYETETPFSDSTLSAGELAQLAGKCRAIQNNGSGHGICSCGSGDR